MFNNNSDSGYYFYYVVCGVFFDRIQYEASATSPHRGSETSFCAFETRFRFIHIGSRAGSSLIVRVETMAAVLSHPEFVIPPRHLRRKRAIGRAYNRL